MNQLYDMNQKAREKVKAHAAENGYPVPGIIYRAAYVALVFQHRLSLIMGEIDATIDRIILLGDRIAEAVKEGNFTAVMLLRDRKDEEKKKLSTLERLMMREAPMPQKAKEGEITPAMIERAKEYPMEDLLPEKLKRGRCRCPIHQGKNPMSFEVKNNQGRCHSCGWKGDVLQFVMDTQGIGFPEAVRRLGG